MISNFLSHLKDLTDKFFPVGQGKEPIQKNIPSSLKSVRFVAVVVIATAGWFLSHLFVPSTSAIETSELDTAKKQRADKVFSVQVKNSVAQPYTRTEKFAGQLKPIRRAEIRAKISSTVQKINTSMGQKIKKNTPIVTLDSGAYPANLARTKALFEKQKATLNTIKRLYAQKASSKTQLNDATANYNLARANYITAQEQNDGIIITAPYDGTIESITAQVAEDVKPGQIIATISDLSTVKITVYASEKQIDTIALGQQVNLTLRNGKTMQGTVAHIAVRSNQRTRTFPIEIHAKNTVNARDGSTASATLNMGTITVHSISASILTLNNNGTLGVRVVQGGKVAFYPVTIEQETEDAILVSGLPNTTNIITVGQEYVKMGDTVSATMAK